MKKGIFLIIGLLLIISMIGCGSANEIIDKKLNVESYSYIPLYSATNIETEESLMNGKTIKLDIEYYFVSAVAKIDDINLTYGNKTYVLEYDYGSLTGDIIHNWGEVNISETRFNVVLFAEDNSVFIGEILIDYLATIYVRGVIIENIDYEQRISKIEDDLFEEESNEMIVVHFYDEYECEIYPQDIMNSTKTKDKIKQLKRTSCRNLAMINEIKNDIILAIQDSISNIWLTITGHITRIEALENQTFSISCINCTSDYLNYLSSSKRKKMVCGYAEDNNLTYIKDLGYECYLTYKTYSSGRVRVRCKCDRI